MNRLTRKIETLCKRISTHLPTEENKFQIYLDKIEKYKRYSSLQLECKYLDVKTRLGYNRMVYLGCIVTLFVSILLGWWKWMLQIMVKLLQSHPGDLQLENILFAFALAITLIFLTVFHEIGKGIKELMYEKDFLELELHKRNNDI